MTDENKKTKPVADAVKAGTLGFSPLTLILALPAPYNHYAAIVFAAMAGAGLAATQIKPPSNPSAKWRWLYHIINFLASNWKWAANAVIMIGSAQAAKGATTSETTNTTVKK